MANLIKKNCFPNKQEFVDLYTNSSQAELAARYKCTKLRIRKWIYHFGMKPRQRGGGNNRKYQPSKEVLRALIDKGHTHREISEILQIRKPSVAVWCRKFNLRKDHNQNEFQKYQLKVRWASELTYRKNKHILNPNNKKRTLCGVKDGCQLDHIISVRECFKNKISINQCASIVNLQLIPWEENLKKRKFGGTK